MSIEALRAALREAQSRSSNNQRKSGSGGDKASFPFWDTKVGESSTVRFLPDGNQDNPFFWQERQRIKMPFDGVVGGDKTTTEQVTVDVPCADMFGMACPVIAATKHLWNGTDEDKNVARIYYKKRSYIFQGFVVNSNIVEEESPENPIRRFVINKSIYDIVQQSLLEPNFESLPTDYTGGRDFAIRKTQKGEWANYGTSSWSYSSRSLTEAERAAIDKFQLFDLKEALGAVPTADHIAAIKEMFEVSYAGGAFDMSAGYAQFYRPYGFGGNSNNAAANASTNSTVNAANTLAATPAATETPAATPAPTPTAETSTAGSDSPQSIIDRLRANSAKLGTNNN